MLSLRVRVPPVDHHLVRRPPQDAPHAVQGLDASNASMGAAGREVKDSNHGWGVEVRPCLARVDQEVGLVAEADVARAEVLARLHLVPSVVIDGVDQGAVRCHPGEPWSVARLRGTFQVTRHEVVVGRLIVGLGVLGSTATPGMSLDQGAVESLPRGRGDLWRFDQANDEVIRDRDATARLASNVAGPDNGSG